MDSINMSEGGGLQNSDSTQSYRKESSELSLVNSYVLNTSKNSKGYTSKQFTPEEDNNLLSLVNKHGLDFKTISKQFAPRSLSQVKKRYEKIVNLNSLFASTSLLQSQSLKTIPDINEQEIINQALYQIMPEEGPHCKIYSMLCKKRNYTRKATLKFHELSVRGEEDSESLSYNQFSNLRRKDISKLLSMETHSMNGLPNLENIGTSISDMILSTDVDSKLGFDDGFLNLDTNQPPIINEEFKIRCQDLNKIKAKISKFLMELTSSDQFALSTSEKLIFVDRFNGYLNSIYFNIIKLTKACTTEAFDDSLCPNSRISILKVNDHVESLTLNFSELDNSIQKQFRITKDITSEKAVDPELAKTKLMAKLDILNKMISFQTLKLSLRYEVKVSDYLIE